MIDLIVNGKPRQAGDNTSLEAYLMTIDVDLKFVAVGYNGEVIQKQNFSKIKLSDGDLLEIVRPVGGGLDLICHQILN
ncbi:MAG: thiamine biosynthesis protein ThiS [Dehalococcoidia bacterium]|nr:thiamine biosynthesis protein ThiS [Dehalococcoidia bacterium]